MKRLIYLVCIIFISCDPFFFTYWAQGFSNNSDRMFYFYLHFYKEGDKTYPAYDEIKEKPVLIPIEGKEIKYLAYWPTDFEYGTIGHMYVFDPDTLARYSWEEVLAKKKYWFTARPCRSDPIQFPEEFEYMGDI